MLQHALESKSPAFAEFCTDYFQFGLFGVTLFFLTSGFIIPVSIEKANSIKSFWISRIYRLFPLYLVSILVTLLLVYLGSMEGTSPTAASLLANAVMLAKFLGQPLIQGLYWTLNLEMVFYLLVTGLFLVGLLKKSALLALGALASALLVGVVGTQVLHLFESGWGLCFQLATMFVGTVYFRYMGGQASAKTWAFIFVAALGVLFTITYFNLFHQDVPEALGTRSFWPVTNAFLAAYLLFTSCFLLRGGSYPASFLFLGRISYSLYLVQATVLPLVLPHLENVLFSTLVGLGTTVLVSYFTYTYIEKPFIHLGRKVVRRIRVSVPQ